MDYSTVISEVTFQPGETRITVPVPIIDDGIFEDVEVFRAHLTTTDDNVNIGDSMATVSIVDNDGEAKGGTRIDGRGVLRLLRVDCAREILCATPTFDRTNVRQGI